MNIHQAIEYVEESPEYLSFRKSTDEHYLVHAFTMIDQGTQAPWQIGYYLPKDDKLVVFEATETVVRKPEEEAFKEGGSIPLLNAHVVTVKLEQALEQAQETLIGKYPHEKVNKHVCILQTIDDTPVWNLTLITLSFNMFNVRINAKTAEIISSNLSSILNLGERV
jgi:hypothetical protein